MAAQGTCQKNCRLTPGDCGSPFAVASMEMSAPFSLSSAPSREPAPAGDAVRLERDEARRS